MHKVPFQGHHLNILVEDKGSSDRPYLFILPGGPGLSYQIYLPFFNQFLESSNLVFIDPPGCGASLGYSEESLTMDQYVEAIDAVTKYLKLEKIQLLGISYGSMVAFVYMTRFPENISKAITIAGATKYHFIALAKENLKKRGTVAQQQICDKFLWSGSFTSQNDIDEFFRVTGALYSDVVSSEKTNPLFASVPFNIACVNNAWRSNFWNFNVEKDLYKINFPLLCIWGKRDWINDPSFGKVIENNVKGAVVKILDAGHSVSKDKPIELQYSIDSFLDSRIKFKV